VSGAVIGEDYISFRSFLSDYKGITESIYGPDACCEKKGGSLPNGEWLTGFVNKAKEVVDAITMHDYPLGRAPDRSCIPLSYTNITQFQSLHSWIADYSGYVTNGGGGDIPLIVGETASTAEGGCDGLSNRFIAGFVFMYELSSLAESRVVQV
jgi:hypothetical protein